MQHDGQIEIASCCCTCYSLQHHCGTVYYNIVYNIIPLFIIPIALEIILESICARVSVDNYCDESTTRNSKSIFTKSFRSIRFGLQTISYLDKDPIYHNRFSLLIYQQIRMKFDL